MSRCIDCDRLMRGQRETAKARPGTVAHAAHGRCDGCYQATRPNRGIGAGRPTDAPVAELIRFLPYGESEMTAGEVVTVNQKRYILLVDGKKKEYSRKEWFEVLL